MAIRLRHNSAFFAATFAALALCAGQCLAGPVDRSIVPDDAIWMVHVDVEAGLASVVGKSMLDRAKEDPRHSAIEQTKRMFGLDISKDVKAVTVIGLVDHQDNGLVIVTTTAAADTMGENLATTKCDGLETNRDRPNIVIHRWKRYGRSFEAAIHAGRIESERFVVLADSPLQLEAGLALLAPKAAAQDQGNRMPHAEPRKGSIFFATAADMNQNSKQRPAAAILQAARFLVIDVGVSEPPPGEGGAQSQKMYGDATIGTADNENAQKIQQLTQGVLAFMAMSAADDADGQAVVADLIKGVKITAERDRCVVESHHDAQTVAKVVDYMARQREKERRDMMEKHRGEKGGQNDHPDGRADGERGPPPHMSRDEARPAAPGSSPGAATETSKEKTGPK